MVQLKPVALFAFFLVTASYFISCSKDDSENILRNDKMAMTGAQETPPVTTSATGMATASYNKETRLMTYTVSWQNLTRPLTAMHIHGVADPGTAAGVVQNIITPSGGIFRSDSTIYGKSGSVSASVFVDNLVIREADLLAGKYYFNIHTAQYPAGEIRGQITF
jgi:hypothetical protein